METEKFSMEEFEKSWKEAEEFMKDYKIVLLVGDKVFCHVCNSELPRKIIYKNTPEVTCQSCGSVYPVKRIKKFLKDNVGIKAVATDYKED